LKLNHLKILKMEQKDSKIFNNKTTEAVTQFCNLNNIENIDEFIYKCFQEGFNIRKYGLLGKTLNEGEKDLKTGAIEEQQVIKEVIVEKVVIKEVPVEVVVEKIIKTVDDTQVNELLLKIQQLEQEISTKTTEIGIIKQEFSTKTEERENIFQNTDNNKLQMLQQTIQNLTSEVRDLKKTNEELKKQLLEKPIESDFTRARFHGGSNLNDGLYK
jgi:predicted RNase H-like nuclease (RuvC/YqgF family)